MRETRRAVQIAWIVLILVVVGFSERTYAYVDFGSGSYVLQLLLAGVFSMTFIARSLWARGRAMFRKSARGKKP
jgi:hypothetical protein